MFSLLFVINVFCEEAKTIPVSAFNVILNEINMDETKIKDVAIKLNIVTENQTIDQIKSSIIEKIKVELKGQDGQPGQDGKNGQPGQDGKDGKSIGLSDLAKSFKVSLTKKDEKGNEVNKSDDELIAEIEKLNNSELTKDLDIIKKVLYYGVAPVTGIITLYILFKGFLSKNNNNNVEQEN